MLFLIFGDFSQTRNELSNLETELSISGADMVVIIHSVVVEYLRTEYSVRHKNKLNSIHTKWSNKECADCK